MHRNCSIHKGARKGPTKSVDGDRGESANLAKRLRAQGTLNRKGWPVPQGATLPPAPRGSSGECFRMRNHSSAYFPKRYMRSPFGSRNESWDKGATCHTPVKRSCVSTAQTDSGPDSMRCFCARKPKDALSSAERDPACRPQTQLARYRGICPTVDSNKAPCTRSSPAALIRAPARVRRCRPVVIDSQAWQPFSLWDLSIARDEQTRKS